MLYCINIVMIIKALDPVSIYILLGLIADPLQQSDFDDINSYHIKGLLSDEWVKQTKTISCGTDELNTTRSYKTKLTGKGMQLVHDLKYRNVRDIPLFPNPKILLQLGSSILTKPYDLPWNSGAFLPNDNLYTLYRVWKYLRFIAPGFLSYRLTKRGLKYLNYYFLDWIGKASLRIDEILIRNLKNINKEDRALALSLADPAVAKFLSKLWRGHAV